MPDEPLVVTDLPSTEPGEPALSSGLSVGAATLLVDGLVLFGAPLTSDQKSYAIALVTFLAPLVAGFVIRTKVFSPKTVEQITAALKMVVADRERSLAEVQGQLHTATSVAPIQATLPALVAKLPDPPHSNGAGSYPVPPQAPAPAPQERPRSFLGSSPMDEETAPPQPVQSPAWPPPGTVQTAEPQGWYDYAPQPPAAPEPARRSRHRLPDGQNG